MTAWTKKHGLTHDSMGPTLHLDFADFKSEADYAAFGKAATGKYADMLPEIVRGAIEVWRGHQEPTGQWVDDESIRSGKITPGDLTPHAKDFAAKCIAAAASTEPISESNPLNPRVAEAIAHYIRWTDAGKPVDGIA